jgi:hypothetical protein
LPKARFETLRNKIGVCSKTCKEECWQLPHLLLKKRSSMLWRFSQDWFQIVRMLVANKAVIDQLFLCFYLLNIFRNSVIKLFYKRVIYQ